MTQGILKNGAECFSLIAVLICKLALSVVAAPQVHVFEKALDQAQTTVEHPIKSDPGSYRMLMIPVITGSTSFDPANNLLDSFDPNQPALRQSLIDRMDIVADFWHEASYQLIELQPTVLNRYYQLPLSMDDYYYPSYVEAGIIGRPVISASAAIPTGDLALRLHFSDNDDSIITLELSAADSPYTHDSLTHILQDQVDPDRLQIEVSSDNRLRIFVVRRHVDAGVYVRVEENQSDAAVVEALGLNAGAGAEGVVIAQPVGAVFPLTAPQDETIGMRLEFASGSTQDFLWTIPAGSSFANPAAFVAAHGNDVANATVVATGNDFRFELEYNPAETVQNVIFDAVTTGNASVAPKWGFADALWGLSTILVTEGVVTHAKRDTLKYDTSLTVGQAIAAYMLNELTRPPSGNDSIPNIDITNANEAALNEAFQDNILDYHSIQVIFLDVTGKRARAGGGTTDTGIKNGDYIYQFQSYSDYQVNFSGTDAGTLSHETGHNIEFPDLYDNAGGNYDAKLVYPQDWDIMDSSALHHPGAWNKAIDADWVALDGGAIAIFPEPDAPGAETRRYVLTPLEYSSADYDVNLAGVPADRELVKVIRLPLGAGDSGDDHFILIEARQRTSDFSKALPTVPSTTDPGGIHITDCIRSKEFEFFEITTRNYVHSLTDKPLLTGDNATPLIALVPNNTVNFEAAYPAYAGITINVVGELLGSGGARSFMVDITREQDDYLDLRIAPWGAPPWESPDIWIEQGDKEELSDEPLEGNGEQTRWSADYDPNQNDGQPLNWIRVRVENNGTIEARDVQVLLQINQPGGIGDTGTWEEFPLSEKKDISAGGDAIFNFPWNPKVGEHTCLKAEVFRWEADLGDITPSNNGAQENVNDFQPTSNSPWTPTPFKVEVFNPFDYSMDMRVVAENVPFGMTVSIDQAFFTLPARTSVVRSAVLKIDDLIFFTPLPNGAGGLTFIYRDPVLGTLVTKKRIAEQFHIVGYATPDGDFDVPIGGVTYNVFPTTTTKVNFAATVGGCDNLVIAGSTTPPAAGEKLEVEVRYPSGRREWIDFVTTTNGAFLASFAPKEGGNLRLTVIYPPGGLFAPTRSAEQTVFNPFLTVEGQAFPSGAGTIDGTGCANQGTRAVLTARPNVGFSFVGWTNKFTSAFVSSVNPLSAIVSSNLSYIAAFAPDPKSAKPELQITKFTAPTEAESRANLAGQITLRLSNAGAVAPTNSFVVGLYFSSDDTLDSKDTALLPARFTVSLANGEPFTLSRRIPLVLPNVPAGSYFLIATVDEGDRIDEVDERNNTRALPITISRGTTYDEWLKANRYVAGAGENDDDKDHLANVAEFYFDQNPLDPNDNRNTPRIVKNEGALELHFGRLRNLDGATGTLQIATALGAQTNWREATESRDYRVLSITPNRTEEQVKYQIIPARRTATFYRLLVRKD